MKFSFKKFVELVDQEADLTEEQLDEIFGVFATHDKKQQQIAKQKSDEFKARRDALKKKAAGVSDEEDEEDLPKNRQIKPIKTTADRQIKPIQTQPRVTSAAAAGRAAERDWVANMESVNESVSSLEDMVKFLEGKKFKNVDTEKNRVHFENSRGFNITAILRKGKWDVAELARSISMKWMKENDPDGDRW